jgi:hypothetical protein
VKPISFRAKNPSVMAGRVIALEVVGYVPAFQPEPDKVYKITVADETKKRSLDANAYFHVLVGEIAAVLRIGEDEAKKNLVLDYGTIARDDEGVPIGFKLPVSVRVETIYDYAKLFKTVEEGGKSFNCYLVYKRTRDMFSNEFSRLLDGAITEAKELGIETATPAELTRMKEEMREAEARGDKHG